MVPDVLSITDDWTPTMTILGISECLQLSILHPDFDDVRVLGVWVPGCLRHMAPYGTDPVSLSPLLSFSSLSIRTQTNPTLLFLQSQLRRISVREQRQVASSGSWIRLKWPSKRSWA